MSDDLPTTSPMLELAVNIGGMIEILEASARGVEQLIEGYESMAGQFEAAGVDTAAEALRAGNAALVGHCSLLRTVGATLEPVVTIFHEADQGDE